MYRYLIFVFAMLSVFKAYCVESEAEIKKKQAELDVICEDARDKALLPRREEIYQECLSKEEANELECKQEAANYNGTRASRGPLYYDLPECDAAFKYLNKIDDGS